MISWIHNSKFDLLYNITQGEIYMGNEIMQTEQDIGNNSVLHK